MSGEIESWGETSATLRALPNAKWRTFVERYVQGMPPNAAKAYREAGFRSSTTIAQARDAHRLLRDERVKAAVAELTQVYWRGAAPEAVAASLEIIRDVNHKDRARVAMSLINRVDPEITRSHLEITARRILSPDEEALEELAALRKLKVAREAMVNAFGENGLARLSASRPSSSSTAPTRPR